MKIKTNWRWVLKIVILSICMSAAFTFVSGEILGTSGYIAAFSVLIIFILIGIIFDMIGVAATSANEAPFHSMASHKEKGAAEAIRLVRSAEKVSSVCNDVVGDISGIVSGTTAAVIVTSLVRDFQAYNVFFSLLVSSLVAGLTIGGKAIGKAVAINNNTVIILTCGKVIGFFSTLIKKKEDRM